MRRSGAINCPMSNAYICHYSPSVRVIQLPVETPFHIISPNVITHAIARPVHGITLVRIDPSIGLLHIITQRPSPFLSPQTIEPKDNSVFVSETLPSLGITRQLFDAGSWTNHTSAYRGGRLSMGWLQWPTQSAEVNATFAVSPAKPPDFVAVGPAVPARGPGAGGRGARFRAC